MEKKPLSPSALLTGLLAGFTLVLPSFSSRFSSRFAALPSVEVGVPVVAPLDDDAASAVSSSSVVFELLFEFQDAVSGDLLTAGAKTCRFRASSATDGLTRLSDRLSPARSLPDSFPRPEHPVYTVATSCKVVELAKLPLDSERDCS